MDETKSLFDFYSKRELAENFSLDELLNFTRQRNLQEWFAKNFYSSEARKIAAALNNESTDAELKFLLCKLFNLPPETLSEKELAEISELVERKHRRELYLKKIDDRKAELVETQGELVRAVEDDAKLIYLCGGEFRIPLNRGGITYVGCENAIVDLDEDGDVDLDAAEIVLEDLQVFLHHPINLRAEKSKNLKIIDGSKKLLGERPTLKEIFDILRGRKNFETPEDFKTRAENLQGAAVGVVLFDEKDYDIDDAQFNFKPHWDFEYISVLKDFAVGKKFFLNISPAPARTLYANERKLQLFADFTYRGGRLTILNLYFMTKTLGRVAIKIFLTEEKISAENFLATSGGLGYGLEIISDYEVKEIITSYGARFEDESVSHVAYKE